MRRSGEGARRLAVGLAALLALLAVDARASELRRTPVVIAVERVAPATVSITAESRPRGFAGLEEYFGNFPGTRPQRRPQQTLGTGAIVDPRGYVLTNAHVLAGAEKIWVTLADGREFPGNVKGVDRETDLAVIAIKSDAELPVATLAQGDSLMIGEPVIAIGNPFGLSHTVTTGVLSATNRSFQGGQDIQGKPIEYHGFLQTDASINPGNSGGPLLNIDGEVIGINTAIFSGAEGIGFAIPIDRAKRVMDELIEYGEKVPVWLGLKVSELTPALRKRLDVHSPGGVVVSEVFGDSPAARAGLKPGDVLVALDGSQLQGLKTYYEVLRGITEGYSARVRIERNGHAEDGTVKAEVLPTRRADDVVQALLGFKVREMTAEELQLYGGRGMVIQTIAPESGIARVLRPGDVLWAFDDQPLTDLGSYRLAARWLPSRTVVRLIVQRGNIGPAPLDVDYS